MNEKVSQHDDEAGTDLDDELVELGKEFVKEQTGKGPQTLLAIVVDASLAFAAVVVATVIFKQLSGSRNG